MKKTLIILFLILLPFCLYSIGYQRSTVVIKTTVTTISLSDALARSDGIFGLYRLSGGLYQGSSGTDYLVANDISEGDITVYKSNQGKTVYYIERDIGEYEFTVIGNDDETIIRMLNSVIIAD